jgi:general secretion pathway protein G
MNLFKINWTKKNKIQEITSNRGFTLVELLIVIVILGILATIGLSTFASSQQKSRDAKRKTNLAQVAEALELYYNDKGQYPGSDGSGQMNGCGENATGTCTWGSSAFSNTTTGTVYMIKLPEDPASNTYFYIASAVGTSPNKKYQLYARLENENDPSLITTAIDCGSLTCNYGVSSGNTTP